MAIGRGVSSTSSIFNDDLGAKSARAAVDDLLWCAERSAKWPIQKRAQGPGDPTKLFGRKIRRLLSARSEPVAAEGNKVR